MPSHKNIFREIVMNFEMNKKYFEIVIRKVFACFLFAHLNIFKKNILKGIMIFLDQMKVY